jgi:ribosomal protein S18 acetylase RimI-like enzyme
MEQAENIARERGFGEMNLSVHTDNYGAIKFYENANWIRVLENGVWDGKMKKYLSS